ncbi:hypothetical protein P154DRAFT_601994, partial [Amniculicola lignicola CBS 123094]
MPSRVASRVASLTSTLSTLTISTRLLSTRFSSTTISTSLTTLAISARLLSTIVGDILLLIPSGSFLLMPSGKSFLGIRIDLPRQNIAWVELVEAGSAWNKSGNCHRGSEESSEDGGDSH